MRILGVKYARHVALWHVVEPCELSPGQLVNKPNVRLSQATSGVSKPQSLPKILTLQRAQPHSYPTLDSTWLLLEG